MQLRHDYKPSEVGFIPQDWEVKTLASISTVVRGGSPRPAGDQRYFNGDFIPWLTVAALTNIPDSQLTVTETFSHLTEEGSKHSRTLEKDTLIIANSGATLGVAKLLGVKCCANDGIAALLNHKEGDKRFLCHFLNSRTKYLREIVATGNGQPNLNTGLIGNIPIPMPPTKEQLAIADALSDADALIDSLEMLIAKKRDIKQAAMQHLLTGKQRLSGFGGEWQAKAIKDIGTVGRGRVISHREIAEAISSDYPVYSSQTTNSGIMGYLDTYDFEGEYITWTTDGANAGKVFYRNGRFNCTNVCGTIRVYDHDARFLALALDAATRQHVSTNLANPKLMNNVMKNISISIPPSSLEEITIANLITEMDTEIVMLEQRLEKTKRIKQGMMQELLTGRVRLV